MLIAFAAAQSIPEPISWRLKLLRKLELLHQWYSMWYFMDEGSN